MFVYRSAPWFGLLCFHVNIRTQKQCRFFEVCTPEPEDWHHKSNVIFNSEVISKACAHITCTCRNQTHIYWDTYWHTHTWHDMTCKHHHPIPTPSSMSPRSKFSPGSDDARRSSKTIGPNLPRLRTPVITSRSVQNMEFFCGARLKWPNINM